MKGEEEESRWEAVSEPPVTSPSPTIPSQTPSSFQEPSNPTTSSAPEPPASTGQTPPVKPEHQAQPQPPLTQEPQTSSEPTPPATGKPAYQEPAVQPSSSQATFTPLATTPPPAPGAKKKSKKWWILGGCAGCGCLALVVLLALFLISGGVALFGTLQAPVKAVEEYLQAATTGDFARAYTYLSQDLQKEVDLSSFTRFIQTHAESYGGIDKVKATSVNINNNQATVEGKVIYKDGSRAPLEAALVKEAELWKISTITVKAKE